MFTNKLVEVLVEILPLDGDQIQKLLMKADTKDHGDYALPCFQLAKIMSKAPNLIAKEIVDKIETNAWLERCENVNGYVNFFVNDAVYCQTILEDILQKKERYGSSCQGDGKTCLIEHTSINPNASPHIGRARNAIIGDFITRLMKFEGYDVTVHYFVNDIGKQISMLVLGAQSLPKIEFNHLLDLYVSINHRIEKEPELEQQVFNLLYKLENGDTKVMKQFRDIVNICIEGQTKILKEIGITYDSFDYESQFLFDHSLDTIIEDIKKTGLLFEDSNGRYVVNLDKYDLSPLVVTRGDKTSLYPLRDIAYSIWKSKQNANKNLIVLGQDQQLYFKQIAAIMTELGYTPPEVVHYSFVLLVDGKMSTRNGTVVLLEDFMREAVKKAKEEVLKRQEKVNEEEAKKVAFCALKYSMEKTSNDRNVIFDLENALSFEGDTGSYLLYSYVRIRSILNKIDLSENYEYDYTLLKKESEIDLIKSLAEFPEIIAKAKMEYSPHIITHYAFELAKKFSAFYGECSIINAETENVKGIRIRLILAVSRVLENIFYILGIDSIERM